MHVNKVFYYNKKFYSCVFICYSSVLQRHSATKNNVTNWKKPNSGPKGLRSLGSPVMSRLLYQAELWAQRQNNSVCNIKWYRVSNMLDSNYLVGGSELPSTYWQFELDHLLWMQVIFQGLFSREPRV